MLDARAHSPHIHVVGAGGEVPPLAAAGGSNPAAPGMNQATAGDPVDTVTGHLYLRRAGPGHVHDPRQRNGTQLQVRRVERPHIPACRGNRQLRQGRELTSASHGGTATSYSYNADGERLSESWPWHASVFRAGAGQDLGLFCGWVFASPKRQICFGSRTCKDLRVRRRRVLRLGARRKFGSRPRPA